MQEVNEALKNIAEAKKHLKEYIDSFAFPHEQIDPHLIDIEKLLDQTLEVLSKCST